MKTLSARAAEAASVLQLGDGDVSDGAPSRRRDVRVVALGGGTGLPVLADADPTLSAMDLPLEGAAR